MNKEDHQRANDILTKGVFNSHKIEGSTMKLWELDKSKQYEDDFGNMALYNEHSSTWIKYTKMTNGKLKRLDGCYENSQYHYVAGVDFTEHNPTPEPYEKVIHVYRDMVNGDVLLNTQEAGCIDRGGVSYIRDESYKITYEQRDK